jgi:hypothetical protein
MDEQAEAWMGELEREQEATVPKLCVAHRQGAGACPAGHAKPPPREF